MADVLRTRLPSVRGGTDPALDPHDRGATRLVTFALLLVLYYLSYRYPLQINSSTTSPSYSDTPSSLQAAKYLLYAVLVGLAVVYFGTSRSVRSFARTIVPPAIVLGAASVAVWPVAQAILFKRADLVENGIFFALSVVVLLAAPVIRPAPVVRVLQWFTVIAIVVNGVQVLLYLAIGRLPALAYAGTISIRFGSLWDDPNGFAIAIAFVLPIAALGFKRFRIPIVLLLLGSLLLTQSVTGVVSTLAAVVIVWVLQLKVSSTWIPALLVVIAAGAAVQVASLVSNPVVESFVQGKAGSVQGHLNAFSILSDLGAGQLSGFDPMAVTVESGYVDMIGTEGVVYTLIYVVILLALLVRSMRNARASVIGSAGRALHFASATLSVAMLVGLTNLPLQSVFPLNALVAISLIIEFCAEPRSEDLR